MTRAKTIHDVAQHAGVSAATVSRVLNGHNVDPALVSRVSLSVAELGYRPSRVARSLRSRTAKVWGLIIGDIRNSFFTQMARGVEDVAAELGYSIVLCNTDERVDKEAGYVELVLDEHMAGCIITPADANLTSVSSLQAAGIPVVTVDRMIEGAALDAVRLDNRAAAASATRHLQSQGFMRVGCISGPKSTTTGRERGAGYLDVMGGSDELLRHADFQVEGGYRSTQSLFQLSEPPDALVVGNGLMMIGVLRALMDLGIAVEEVGLIGFDELEWAEFASPSLSTIGQPTYEMGRAAAKQLAIRIDGDDSPSRELVLESILIARESSMRLDLTP